MAIIALLVAILLPSLTKAREQARITVCLSNLKSIGLAAFLYGADNDDYFPPYAPWPEGTLSLTWKNYIWHLWPYAVSGDSPFPNDLLERQNFAYQNTTFRCPSQQVEGAPFGVRSYRVNATTGSTDGNGWFGPGGFVETGSVGMFGRAVTKINNPAGKMYAIDVHYNEPGYYQTSVFYEGGTDTQRLLYDTFYGGYHIPGFTYPVDVAPHSSGNSYGVNMTYADGHAERTQFDGNTLLLPGSIWVYDE